LHPLASSKSKGGRRASSAFLYTLANGDARVLTYFSGFSCTLPPFFGHTTHIVFSWTTDSASPL
jgi:hypothetical protein